jgi:cytochrome P450
MCTTRTLIFAASDTTSVALSRVLYLLSKYADIQDSIRTELKNACDEGGNIIIEKVLSLPTLDAVLRETMRL